MMWRSSQRSQGDSKGSGDSTVHPVSAAGVRRGSLMADVCDDGKGTALLSGDKTTPHFCRGLPFVGSLLGCSTTRWDHEPRADRSAAFTPQKRTPAKMP